MKALITAGGRATRMRPITYTLNKHLIPLANKPMIWNALEKLSEAGVKEVGIIVNVGEEEIQKAVGDGSRWGLTRIEYIEQRGGPLGIAHAVNEARPFLGEEPFIFYLGDNIILGSIKRFVEKFEKEKLNCLLALSKVKDPRSFGVPEFKDGKIIRVDEKPSNPKSEYAVTGIYIYDKNFFEAFKNITPSARNEYEISDIHTWLIQNNFAVGSEEITGWWKDTGKPEDLLEGNALLLNEMSQGEVAVEGDIDPTASIQGKVKIGKGTVVGPGCLIRGPVAIGENCRIERAFIGPFTSIGNGVEVDGAELEHSIVMEGASIRCNGRIVDAIIGQKAKITSCHETKPRGHKLIIGDNAVVEL